MGTVSEDVQMIMNPAMGAALIWRFCAGYNARSHHWPILHLGFLVLPLLYHAESYNLLRSTLADSGLAKFAEKLTKTPDNYVRSELIEGVKIKINPENLFALHHRVASFKELSFASILLGIDCGLLKMSTETGQVYANLEAPIPRGLDSSAVRRLEESRKLGILCAPHSLEKISNILNVRF